jgi:outer membrane receptor for ferrienterochelin and colicin
MKTRLWMKATGIFILLCGLCMIGMMAALPAAGLCAEDTGKVYKLDDVVVSTTRTEIPVFDVPQTVTVLHSEEIMASPFTRVEDIVRSVPGIHNFRHHSLQTNGIVSPLIMRGVGKNRVLLLVDGVPQNDNFNNAIAWVGWGHIPRETVERIEIVKGPASAMYGSEGLGGVIHIITRKPSLQPRTMVRGEVDPASTWGASAFHSRKINDVGFLAYGGYENSDGYYMKEKPEDYEIKRYRELGRLMGKATWDLGPQTDIALAALYYDYDGGQGRPFFYNEMTLDQYWLTANHKGDHFGLKGLAYLNRVDKTAFQDTASDNYMSAFRDEKMKGTYTWGTDMQGTLPVGKGADLTLGAAFKRVNWEYKEDYPGSERDAGAQGVQHFISPFVNMDMRFLEDRLIINLGGRYDWMETTDGANWDTQASAGKPAYDNTYPSATEKSFSPKLGLAYHPDSRTTLRVSGGKGFRAPSLFELYKVHVRGGGTSYREANPYLTPEEIWSYDVGAERFFTDTVWARVTFFQGFASDYIGSRLTGTGVFAGGKTRYEYVLDNIGEVDIHGVEMEASWTPTEKVTLLANYTYTISEVAEDKNNPDLEGNYLPNEPRHSVHTGFRYYFPDNAHFNLMANYYADIYYDDENTLKTGDYWTVDIGFSQRIARHLSLHVNMVNIFNEKYTMFRSLSAGETTAPGVIVSAGLTLDF